MQVNNLRVNGLIDSGYFSNPTFDTALLSKPAKLQNYQKRNKKNQPQYRPVSPLAPHTGCFFKLSDQVPCWIIASKHLYYFNFDLITQQTYISSLSY